jgi:hypothetical protein
MEPKRRRRNSRWAALYFVTGSHTGLRHKLALFRSAGIHPAIPNFPYQPGPTPAVAGKIIMNKFSKAVILGTAAIATVATTVEFASARDRYPYWRHRDGHFHDRAVAAGVLGLTAGVLVGTALSQPRVVYRERPLYRPAQVIEEEPVYVEPEAEYVGPVEEYSEPDEVYVRPRHVEPLDDEASDENYFPDRPQRRQRQDYAGQGTLEPWTAEWRAYCSQRFQSFNARTGTYTGYDGQSHFCTAG